LLTSILSRSEFRGVQGPSLWGRIKQRVSDFLLHLLGRLVSSSSIPMISDILVYGLIVIAVLAVAYWLYRSLRDGTRLETIMPNVLPVSAKEWPLWLAEARAAAARGEWRDAIISAIGEAFRFSRRRERGGLTGPAHRANIFACCPRAALISLLCAR
jgi:hypothetical protein